jgi:hypothetical protein
MAADTIREFLVALGFKVDQSSLKKFETAISKTTKAVVELAVAVEAMAAGVSIALERFSSNLESLYYSANRVGTTVTHLKAFDLAAQNFGASAEDAQSAAEGLAHALRINPGNEGLLRSLGVNTRDGHGGLRDMTDILADLGKAFASQPIWVAEQYSQMLGINEHTLLAMRNPGFGAELARQRQLLNQTGFDQAAKDAHAFMVQVRTLGAQLEVFGVQVVDALQTKFGLTIKQLSSWLATNGPQMAKSVADFASSTVTVLDTTVIAVEKLIDAFQRLNAVSGGAAGKGALAGAAVGFVRGGVPGAVVGGVLGAGAGGALGSASKASAPLMARMLTSLDRWVHSSQWAQMPGVIATLERLGFSPNAAAGIGGNLWAESTLDPTAIGDHGNAYGIAQWHKPYWAMFAKMFGHDIHQSTLGEQLEFLQRSMSPALTASLNHAASADLSGQLFSNRYERPANPYQAAYRGQIASVISQQITIRIDGAQSAQATAKQVQRSLQQLTRNALPAVQ